MELADTIWSKSKLVIKAVIIAGIVLFLQIPTFYIKDLIEERESRQKEAITEVSNKWAGRQNITGPILVLPYWEYSDTAAGRKGTKQYASFLPSQLNIQSQVHPREKHRGIYKVMLYQSQTKMNGNFQDVELQKMGIAPVDVIWNEAYVKIYISDVRGLNEEPRFNWNGKEITMTSSHLADAREEESMVAALQLTGYEDLVGAQFSSAVNLNGSDQLLFTPVGKTTEVKLNSTWPHPSFTGEILPQSTHVHDSGFVATWKSLSHKRNFPQQWKGESFKVMKPEVADNSVAGRYQSNNLSSASFGTSLFIPVNGYQKTLRSVKYAALCILLTFAAFFLIEIANKKSVHPFQYGLVGVALVLFYTLLLSFSEYIGFDFSYGMASVLTIGLIAWFVKGLLGTTKATALLASILVLLYTYVFTLLQLQDYSLLLGSIGLFLTLAVIMHFSKKIQW